MGCGKYCIGNEEPIDNLFFVTGACRSGKTLFSKILASTQNTEWIEEPYELSLLLWAIQAGKSSADLEWEEKAFNAICKELINSAILLRNGNFRPEDLSTIWNYKEAKEIFQRLVNINTRNQVQYYIKENNSHFIIDIPGILGSSEFMKRACKGVRIIHVIRNPYDVAEAVCQKHWNSNESLEHPLNNDIYRKFNYKGNTEYYIPWWVKEGMEYDFVEATEYERGIIYWVSMVENYDGSDILIKYEDLVQAPQEEMKSFLKLGLQPTTKTMALSSELQSRYILEQEKEIHLNRYYADKFRELKEMYKYG